MALQISPYLKLSPTPNLEEIEKFEKECEGPMMSMEELDMELDGFYDEPPVQVSSTPNDENLVRNELKEIKDCDVGNDKQNVADLGDLQMEKVATAPNSVAEAQRDSDTQEDDDFAGTMDFVNQIDKDRDHVFAGDDVADLDLEDQRHVILGGALEQQLKPTWSPQSTTSAATAHLGVSEQAPGLETATFNAQQRHVEQLELLIHPEGTSPDTTTAARGPSVLPPEGLNSASLMPKINRLTDSPTLLPSNKPALPQQLMIPTGGNKEASAQLTPARDLAVDRKHDMPYSTGKDSLKDEMRDEEDVKRSKKTSAPIPQLKIGSDNANTASQTDTVRNAVYASQAAETRPLGSSAVINAAAKQELLGNVEMAQQKAAAMVKRLNEDPVNHQQETELVTNGVSSHMEEPKSEVIVSDETGNKEASEGNEAPSDTKQNIPINNSKNESASNKTAHQVPKHALKPQRRSDRELSSKSECGDRIETRLSPKQIVPTKRRGANTKTGADSVPQTKRRKFAPQNALDALPLGGEVVDGTPEPRDSVVASPRKECEPPAVEIEVLSKQKGASIDARPTAGGKRRQDATKPVSTAASTFPEGQAVAETAEGSSVKNEGTGKFRQSLAKRELSGLQVAWNDLNDKSSLANSGGRKTRAQREHEEPNVVQAVRERRAHK
ncbi:hypothetical protein LTR37_005199 [Vermiconidia calcicola]|uniref:Uncharacterized protein n=1 Tax=Vermiconidia calcicola TaxID=1690605 RepID=A0ACC3NKF3_9PEZI|nr:hypothetical protein LTR37_005199 [Vermiconidia calcicola]